MITSREALLLAYQDFNACLIKLRRVVRLEPAYSTRNWFSLLFIIIFAKKLLSSVQDAINAKVESRENPDIVKLTAVLNQYQRTIMTKRNDEAALSKRRKPTIPSDENNVGSDGGGRLGFSCALEGCARLHCLYKRPRFLGMTVNRIQVVQTNRFCLLCLQAGHQVARCSQRKVMGLCKY